MEGSAPVGEEAVPDDLGLLFKAIVFEPATVFEPVGISAERMSHQRQIEASARLRLPHMSQLVDEESLSVERLFREIVGPQVGMRMEMHIAHGRHGHALWLEGPPFAPNQPDLRVIDRVGEDRSGDLYLARGKEA